MKKIWLTMFCTFVLMMLVHSGVWATGLVGKFGYDQSGDLTISGPAEMPGDPLTAEVEAGFTVGAEYLYDFNERFIFGGGLEYQINRTAQDANYTFAYLPVYGLIRYQLPVHNLVKIYLTGKGGYNFFRVQEELEGIAYQGGLYYSYGGGIILHDKYQLEFLFSTHNSAITNDGGNFEYTKLGISCGILF